MFCFSQIMYDYGEITSNVFGIMGYMSEENELLLFNKETSNSRRPATVRSSKVHTTHGIPVTSQYGVPVVNQYSALTNHYESHKHDDILFSNSEQSTRSMPVSNHKYVKGLRKKNTLAVIRPRLQMNHSRHKPNLQEPINNEDGACPIPTLVKSITSVNPNPKTAPKCSEPMGNLTSKLRETTEVYNKESSLS